MKFLLLNLLLASAFLFSACEKDNIRRSSNSVIDTPVDDSASVNEKPKAAVINLDGLSDLKLNVSLNGKSLLRDLQLEQVNQLLQLEEGDIKIDLISNDGKLLSAANVKLFKREVLGLFIALGQDGVTPQLTLLGINPSSFLPTSGFGQGLGRVIDPNSLFALNVLDLSKTLNGEKLLLGADYLNGANKLVPGLLDLNNGEFSGVLFGNDAILSNLSLLTSSLPLDDLLARLGANNPSLAILNLGSVLGLNGLNPGTGLIEGVLNLVKGLLNGLLGNVSSNPLTLLNGDLLNQQKLLPGHKYTMVVFGEVGKLKTTLLDLTALGLVK